MKMLKVAGTNTETVVICTKVQQIVSRQTSLLPRRFQMPLFFIYEVEDLKGKLPRETKL